jgi:hypothetical protein
MGDIKKSRQLEIYIVYIVGVAKNHSKNILYSFVKEEGSIYLISQDGVSAH